MQINKKLFWIYLLSGAIYATQGFEGLPGLALFLYLKEILHFTPEKVMLIGSVTGIAWIIKPLLGFAIDNYLTKRTWIIISLLGSIGIALWMGLSPILTIPILIIAGILANYNSASRDVAVDGIMCVSGKEEDSCDKIQAIQWISITIASIGVGLGGGYIAEHYSYKLAYLCLIPVYIVILGIVFNYKTKQPLKRKCCGCKFELECNDIQVVFSEGTNCYIPRLKKSFLQTLISYKQLFTNKSFLFACLFLFLYKFSPSFGTPLSYIERDVFKWSAQFMGTLGAILSALEIIGAVVFYKYCKIINVKKWLYISVFLGACTTLSYLYFTPVSAIIYGICYSILGMFIHLIVMAWMAKATLSGKEATSFALLCSINNFAAGTASSLTGAFLLPKIGLQPLIILSAITSFACLPLIKKLEIK
jgi:predicted MFS family arabinose efflux permease